MCVCGFVCLCGASVSPFEGVKSLPVGFAIVFDKLVRLCVRSWIGYAADMVAASGRESSWDAEPQVVSQSTDAT